MTIYSRVSRLDGLATIRRARRLPYPGEVLTPVGQQVGPVQVVARAPDYLDFQVLRASEVLGVDPGDLDKYLLVDRGANLEKGMPLMERPGLFGRSKIFRSPLAGYLNMIHDGCLVVQRLGDLIELRAQLPGRIVSIIPERGVVIEATGALIQAVWDSGKEGFGRLLKASESGLTALQTNMIGSQGRGAVLVAGTCDDMELLHRLEEQGVRGLIVGSLTDSMSQSVRQLSYPVIVTDGLGKLPMAEPIFHHLSESEGREVSLLAAENGPHPQPVEIFIPLPAPRQNEPKVNSVEVGSKVRVLNPGGDIAVGAVFRIRQLPQKNGLGTPMPGADVEIHGGERKFVPYTNLELLHG